jgi:mRNA export factor
MDLRENPSGGGALVVCTEPQRVAAGGTKSFYHVYDLNNPQAPLRSVESPLKFQSRAVRIFSDNQVFVVSSLEGRCAIKPLEARFEACGHNSGCRNNAQGVMQHFGGCPQLQQGEPTNGHGKVMAFNFRCHRSPADATPLLVYPVNAIDCHPDAHSFSAVFATGGSDGTLCLWQRRERSKLTPVDLRVGAKPYQDMKGPQIGAETVTYNAGSSRPGQQEQFRVHQPVVDVKFSRAGDLIAYACSYDWHKGAEHHKAEHVPSIYVKSLTPDDLRQPPR